MRLSSSVIHSSRSSSIDTRALFLNLFFRLRYDGSVHCSHFATSLSHARCELPYGKSGSLLQFFTNLPQCFLSFFGLLMVECPHKPAHPSAYTHNGFVLLRIHPQTYHSHLGLGFHRSLLGPFSQSTDFYSSCIKPMLETSQTSHFNHFLSGNSIVQMLFLVVIFMHKYDSKFSQSDNFPNFSILKLKIFRPDV